MIALRDEVRERRDELPDAGELLDPKAGAMRRNWKGILRGASCTVAECVAVAAVLVACLASFPSPGQQQRPSQGLGGASFAPFFFPNSGRISYSGDSIPSPCFQPTVRKLVFASNRDTKQPREINIFLADWLP